MNKEYTYFDGKAIIRNENGNQPPIEYYDNLDAVLVQENVIETMEDRISFLEEESKKYKTDRKHYIPILLPMCTLLTAIFPSIFAYGLGNADLYITTVNTVFGPMNEALLYTISTLPVLPFIGGVEYIMYDKYKEGLKTGKGINCELEFLKKQVMEEREKLIELKKDKTVSDNKKEFRVVEVNDLERLKALRSLFSLYYNLGYYDEKLYDYYQKGKLDSKLSERFNEEEIQAAKEYLEEKGPTLVKKRKSTNSNNKNC